MITLLVIFHIINHATWYQGIPPSHTQIDHAIANLNLALSDCDRPQGNSFRVRNGGVYRWSADTGDFNLDTIRVTRDSSAINVYFFEGDFTSFSDGKDAFISDYDRISFSGNEFTIAHEVAHVLAGLTHDHSGKMNLLADARDHVGLYFNPTQCDIIQYGWEFSGAEYSFVR